MVVEETSFGVERVVTIEAGNHPWVMSPIMFYVGGSNNFTQGAILSGVKASPLVVMVSCKLFQVGDVGDHRL